MKIRKSAMILLMLPLMGIQGCQTISSGIRADKNIVRETACDVAKAMYFKPSRKDTEGSIDFSERNYRIKARVCREAKAK